MAQEDLVPEKNQGKSWFEMRATKITSTILIVAGILAAVDQILETKIGSAVYDGIFASNLVVPDSPGGQLRDCISNWELSHRDDVAISKWSDLKLKIKGNNECEISLQVHIAFKTTSAQLRFLSPVAGCENDIMNAPCWQQKSLSKHQELEWDISPPRLDHVLKLPLEKDIEVNINWLVVDGDTGTILKADDTTIKLREDPDFVSG